MALKMLFFAQSVAWMNNKKNLELNVIQPTSLLKLLKTHSHLAPLLEKKSYLRVAINQEFSDFNKEVKDGDEVAFFPPFSGG